LSVALWRGLDTEHQWIAKIDPSLRGSVGRTDYRLDGLLWGAAIALLLWSWPGFQAVLVRLAGTAMAVSILSAIAVVVYWKPPAYLAIMPMLMALLPVATCLSPRAVLSRALEWAPLQWVGRISYGLYVWQQLFLPVSELPKALGWIQSFPLNIAFAFAAAAISYYLVERRSIEFGKRLSSN
jgi:peptidoglycan/LPS O-acetylase OafA/YrhL